MTRRDDLKVPIFEKMTQELGRPDVSLLRYFEGVAAVTYVGTRCVRVIVKSHPSGENPEFYQGRESWTVELLDDDGELIARVPDAQESLDLALQMIDWDVVRAALAEV